MSANPMMERLVSHYLAEENSQFTLWVQFASPEHGLRLAFQLDDRELEPLQENGVFWVRYVTLGNGERRIVMLGDNIDEPRVDRVVLSTPNYDRLPLPLVIKPRHWRPVWMHIERFTPGPVTVWWMMGDQVHHKEQTTPLEWGTPWPPAPGSQSVSTGGVPAREAAVSSERDWLRQRLRDDLAGRQIVDVRFVTDDERVRPRNPPPADPPDWTPIFKGEPGFETNEVKLCLDNGTEIQLDLHAFSQIKRSGYERIAPDHIPPRFTLRDGMTPDELPDALRGESEELG